MIRRYFLFGLMTLLFSVSIFAQYEQTGGFARLRGMGNNPYVIDPSAMTVNPGWGGYYRNFIFGDLGGPILSTPWGSGGVGQFIAANFHLGGGLSLGAMLTRNDFVGGGIGTLDPGGVAGLGVVGQINTYLGSAGFPTPSGTHVIPLNNNVELFGSYRAGNTSFGFGVAYASTTNEFAPDTGDGIIGSASQIGFNAGIVTKLTGSFLLDVGASFILPSASFKPRVGSNTDVSQTLILVNARMFWQYSSKLSFIPALTFATVSGTLDSGKTNPNLSTGSADLPSLSVLSAGLGMNYEVGDFLLAGGLGFASLSAVITPELSGVRPDIGASAFVFPVWNLGVEWNLTDWLVGRFGYVASTISTTTESFATVRSVNENIITLFGGPYGQSNTGGGATLGVGFRLGNFSIDATVNEDVLRQGLNNIGGGGSVIGATNNGATFAYLSISYAMP